MIAMHAQRRKLPASSSPLCRAGSDGANSERTSELMRLLPLWPHEIADTTPNGRRRLLALLRGALRAERQRGLAGHWTYDLSRHAQLLKLYRLECSKVAKVTDGAVCERGHATAAIENDDGLKAPT